MITLSMSQTLDISGSKSCEAVIALLSDVELKLLAVFWRHRARRGDREAFGPARALEVEQRHRQPTPTMIERPRLQTVFMTRPWWKFRGMSESADGEPMTFR
jgi:hypothetical protein